MRVCMCWCVCVGQGDRREQRNPLPLQPSSQQRPSDWIRLALHILVPLLRTLRWGYHHYWLYNSVLYSSLALSLLIDWFDWYYLIQKCTETFIHAVQSLIPCSFHIIEAKNTIMVVMTHPLCFTNDPFICWAGLGPPYRQSIDRSSKLTDSLRHIHAQCIPSLSPRLSHIPSLTHTNTCWYIK